MKGGETLEDGKEKERVKASWENEGGCERRGGCNSKSAALLMQVALAESQSSMMMRTAAKSALVHK